MVTVTGTPFKGVDGSALYNVEYSFTLCDEHGIPMSVYDATTGDLIQGSVHGTTDAEGQFSEILWENYKGTRNTWYQFRTGLITALLTIPDSTSPVPVENLVVSSAAN